MTSTIRHLYLDLLFKSLSNLIYGAPPDDPWNDGLFRRDAKSGRDRQSPAHTMVGVNRLRNVWELTQRALDEGVPGDVIETGVWRGGCCIMMRGVLAANGVTDRRVFVADSFAGLPPPNVDAFPQDEGHTFHLIPELAVPLDEVKGNFARYGLLDGQVVFVPGFFGDTLPGLEAGPFALLRLDGDMYESTYVALASLYPRLSPGGFVIIDDYGAIEGCRRAVADFRAEMGIDAPLHAIDWTGMWWRKGGAPEERREPTEAGAQASVPSVATTWPPGRAGRRRCLIHIGTHKTGTTSIQAMLAGVDLDRAGLYYPRAGIAAPLPGHHNIAWELSGDRRFEPDRGTIDDLLRETAPIQADVVLSSEDFECAGGRLGRLTDALAAAGFDVTLLVYLRDQVGYARSLYNQMVRMGYPEPFDAFARTVIQSRRFRWREWSIAFCHRELLESLPRDVTIIARPYEASASVLGDIARVLGRDPAELGAEPGGPRLNRRARLSEVVPLFYRNRTGRCLDGDAAALLASLADSLDTPHVDISPATRAALVAAFRDSNAWATARHGFAGFGGGATDMAPAPGGLTLDDIFSDRAIALLDAAARVTAGQREALAAEREGLTAAQALLTQARDRAIAERDAMLASSSWRATAPLRRLRGWLGPRPDRRA